MLFPATFPQSKVSDVQHTQRLTIFQNASDVENNVFFGNKGVPTVFPPHPSPLFRRHLEKPIKITDRQLGDQRGTLPKSFERAMGFQTEFNQDFFQTKPFGSKKQLNFWTVWPSLGFQKFEKKNSKGKKK